MALPRSRLTLHHLESFVRVADLLSFRKAAEALHMSQPALSRSVQGAEDALGARLFDRDTRNVRLTPAGAELLPIARRMLAEFQSSLDEVSLFLDGDRGRLVIATLPSIGVALLPDVVCEFARAAPAVQIAIHAPHTQMVLDMVMAGEADFGIAMQPVSTEKLHYEHLMDDAFVLICSQDHPLSGRSACDWQVFSEYPFISLSRTTSMHMMTQRVFQQLGMDVHPAYECGGQQLVGKLVAAGLGIAAIPKLVLPQIGDENVRILPLHSPTLHRPLGILTRVGRTPSSAARRFLKLLRMRLTLPSLDEPLRT